MDADVFSMPDGSSFAVTPGVAPTEDDRTVGFLVDDLDDAHRVLLASGSSSTTRSRPTHSSATCTSERPTATSTSCSKSAAERSPRSGSVDDAVADGADALDPSLEQVAGLEEPGWLAGDTDAIGGAGEDHVAG